MFVRRMWPEDGPWTASQPDFSRLQRDVSRLFDLASNQSAARPSAGVFPAINITQDPETYYVRAEIPGVKASDLEVAAERNKLTIAGSREIASEGDGVSYHRRERAGGAFSRSLSLDWDFDPDSVSAHYSQGVLTVTLSKAAPAKARAISVQTS